MGLLDADDPAAWEAGENWLDQVPAGHRAGYVVLLGRPNVGKSSLVNALVGERLAPISPIPQTTRRRLLGILSRDDAQIVFVDTPGIHQPTQRLGEMMVQAARRALVDADLILHVVDVTRPPGEEDALTRRHLAESPAPKFLVINKIDLIRDAGYRAAFEAELPLDATLTTSAVTGAGLPELLAAVLERLPEAPPFFPPDQVTDIFEREVANDLIREAALGCLQQELPHAVAVKVEEWRERDNGLLYVRAWLIVERESQKGIVIGQGGRMIRRIGSAARVNLENWLQQRVYLELQVKVVKKWRKDEGALRWLGLLPE